MNIESFFKKKISLLLKGDVLGVAELDKKLIDFYGIQVGDIVKCYESVYKIESVKVITLSIKQIRETLNRCKNSKYLKNECPICYTGYRKLKDGRFRKYLDILIMTNAQFAPNKKFIQKIESNEG